MIFYKLNTSLSVPFVEGQKELDQVGRILVFNALLFDPEVVILLICLALEDVINVPDHPNASVCFQVILFHGFDFLLFVKDISWDVD